MECYIGYVVELGSKEEEGCFRRSKALKTECEDKVSMSKRGKDEVEEKREDA